MNPKFHALAPWELMNTAKKLIGLTSLELIFKCGHGQIYKFCRNPDYTADSARTPIERMRMLVADVSEQGPEGEDLARAMVDFIADPLGMHCIPDATGTPDKPDVMAECLDDYPALTRLHTAIQEGADVREVQALAEEVRREVDETVVSYRESLEG